MAYNEQVTAAGMKKLVEKNAKMIFKVTWDLYKLVWFDSACISFFQNIY